LNDSFILLLVRKFLPASDKLDLAQGMSSSLLSNTLQVESSTRVPHCKMTWLAYVLRSAVMTQIAKTQRSAAPTGADTYAPEQSASLTTTLLLTQMGLQSAQFCMTR